MKAYKIEPVRTVNIDKKNQKLSDYKKNKEACLADIYDFDKGNNNESLIISNPYTENGNRIIPNPRTEN